MTTIFMGWVSFPTGIATRDRWMELARKPAGRLCRGHEFGLNFAWLLVKTAAMPAVSG
jgi:hypothetical protein